MKLSNFVMKLDGGWTDIQEGFENKQYRKMEKEILKRKSIQIGKNIEGKESRRVKRNQIVFYFQVF